VRKVLYQIRVNYPFFGGDKADGRWHKKEKTSGKKGVIKADLVLKPSKVMPFNW
jgi:hypothetical protein